MKLVTNSGFGYNICRKNKTIYIYLSDYYHLHDMSGLLKAIIDTLETVQRPVLNSLSFAQN